jgi:hypothetical protein
VPKLAYERSPNTTHLYLKRLLFWPSLASGGCCVLD